MYIDGDVLSLSSRSFHNNNTPPMQLVYYALPHTFLGGPCSSSVDIMYVYIYIGWNCVLLDRKMDQCVCVCENFVAFLRLRVLLCVCICAVGWVGHPWVMFQFENIES